MIIGLDASRAFLKQRTGIEEYAYQVIKHLRDEIPSDASVRLYVRKKLRWQSSRPTFVYPEIDFELPANWQVRGIWAPRFWTQAGLSLEMLFRPANALFIPAHTVPVIHPKNTVVTIHGLEYEFCPQAYSWWERFYMRHSIRYSVRAAKTVIAVSENTKRDLMRLYQVPEEKIRVVYEGYEKVQNQEPGINPPAGEAGNQAEVGKPYLLFIGRLEERKNIVWLIEAFEMLKEKDQIPHQLVLAGKPGYGYEKIRIKIQESRFKNEIHELGYITQKEKGELLRKAAVFVFPSLYEGFGLPVVEAQAVGVPVVTSNTSSLPEVGGEGVVYVDPLSSEDIAEGIKKVLQMSPEEGVIMQKAAQENLNRFAWRYCAEEISRLILRL